MKEILNRLAALERKNQTENEGARFLRALKEVEAWFEGCKAAYNSPEAIRGREEAYKESQKTGLLRKAAFYRGESMSDYPLPWDVKHEEHFATFNGN